MSAPAAPLYPDADDEGRLARRRARMLAWRSRSRLILRLRRILPISVAAVLLLLTGWVVVKGWIGRMGDVRASGAAIHMTNAHFYGRDGNGRAYVLGAAEASRSDNDMQQIKLVKPFLQFNADALKPSEIRADRGVYRESTHILRLDHNVVMTDGTGNRFKTEQAIVDTVQSTVNGWTKVEGSGPSGVVTADSYGIYDHGRRIVFSGNVHSIIKPD